MFPIQQRLLTPNPYSRPQKPLSKVRGVVIHWTANEGKGANAEANRRFFEDRKLGKTGYGSAHYIVDDREIVQCIPDNEMAYHVGATEYKTTRFGSYPNASLLGIEMCVNADGNFKVVYEQTVQLAAMLIKKYGLNPDTDLVRHYDITGKNCPAFFTSDHWGKVNNSYAVKYGLGSSADAAWLEFKRRVKEALQGNTASTAKPKPATKSPYPYDVNKGIGVVQVIVDKLNIRKGPSFDAPIEKVASRGDTYYVYGEQNGLYNVGGDFWVTANPKYVKFIPHPK